MNPIPLPRWARISIALACAAIGLASSTVAGWLLVRGLELTEPDSTARVILIAAGVLMVVTELMAFFLVALLPTARLHQLRLVGLTLLVFEITTIFGTRMVINHDAEAAIASQATRLDSLRAAIETRRADAARVRANGERQSASDNAWARHLGTQAIRQADAMERDIEPLRSELADLQAKQRTTLPRMLGPELSLAHSIAMPVLVSTIGLTMFGVAGLMLRRPDDEGEVQSVRAIEAPVPPPVPKPVTPGQQLFQAPYRTTLPRGAKPAIPPAVHPLSAWCSVAAAVPLSVMTAAPAPMECSVIEVKQEEVTAPVTAPVTPVEATVPDGEDRYQRLRAGVLAGQIKPSVRALREAGGGGTDTVRRYLQRLAAEGVITKEGQGYTLASK
ncbi:MAG: hypothetical protein A2486_07115 [Burkholderiales bacterium RIFOXYC12_FULL_65_23]|uniref:hypothetical protein n=1 Tax=Malikia spinosa TaxID=86180 RepID=UPI0008BBD972|nr:MAG: hypothetical protein A2486_07115 [Burkholderiales bacterium RIFOXYC12_FULL_65_23]